MCALFNSFNGRLICFSECNKRTSNLNGLDLQLTIKKKLFVVVSLLSWDSLIYCDMDLQLMKPQVNGGTCVEFGCTHPIDGFFWNLPIYLLGFFSKYECWLTDLIMLLYHFLFWVVTCLFLSWGYISILNVKNKFRLLILNWNLFDQHTNN